MSDVPVRPAATVLVVRDGAEGIEVVMLARRLDSVFAAGAHVFPGGAVDAGDLDGALAERAAGLDDRAASQRLGVPRDGLAYWVAAVRETFEEVGVLLAHRDDGAPVAPGDLARPEWEVRRRAVDRGARSFPSLLDEEGLLLATDTMRPFGRWITPRGAPRRYDTRFFVAPAPAGQEPTADGNEAVSVRWARPVEALAEHADGAIDLILPTERALRAAARFDGVGDLLTAVDHAVARSATVGDHGGWRAALPGDHAGAPPQAPPPARLPVDG